MSASIAYIRFKSTGNVYYACFENASDVLLPNICTYKDCYDIGPIDYCRKIGYVCDSCPSTASDLDDVDIYSEYGGGMSWVGQGSEKLKLLVEDCLDPWEYYETLKHHYSEPPQWVKDFLAKRRKNDEV